MHRLITAALAALGVLTAAAGVPAADALLDRIGGPGTAQRIDTRLDPKEGYGSFTITGDGGKPCIIGSDMSALTTGIGHYLNHVAGVNLSWNRLTADLSAVELPAPAETITRNCSAQYRYYLNYCTFSYSMSTWTWERWQQEIDWMALHGINMPLQIIGLDEVWRRLLTELYGYSDAQANAFIAGPCFQAWWGMNNLEGWGGPNPDWWYKRQAALGKLIGDRERELGMQPVLPGYAGMVPSDFTATTGIPSNGQGNWCAFKRPYILDPNSDGFGRVAKDYYEILQEVLGQSQYYSIDPFHEGANTSGINVPAAYASLWKALNTAAPDASWVIQQWQWSGAQYNVLDKVPNGRLVVLDLFSDGHTHFGSYKGHDAVWCMLPNFGARTGMMGRMNGTIDSYFSCTAQYPSIKGVGATPEGIEQTPVLYDLVFELPWMDAKPDAAEWMAAYADRRYGKANAGNADVRRAWELLRNSALSCKTGLQGPHEAVICGRPGLTVDRVSTWGGSDIFYPRADLIQAARLLLASGIQHPNMDYDVTDAARQALTDYGKTLLAALNAANTAGDTKLFAARRDALLQLILDLDELLNTNATFMLGYWTEMARAIADEQPGTTDADREWLEHDNARTLITTWGPQNASESGGLHDYSYREWGGMLKDFYHARWKLWFDNGMKAPSGGWFAWEKKWAQDRSKRYPVTPQGNTVEIANRLMAHYIVPATLGGKTLDIDRHAANDLTSAAADIAVRGREYRPAVQWAQGDEPAVQAMWLDLDGDGKFAATEAIAAPYILPADMPLTGRRAVRLLYDDGTELTLAVTAREEIPAPRTVAAAPQDPAMGSVTIDGHAVSQVTNADPVTLQAIPAANNEFSHWLDSDGRRVSSENPMTYYGAAPQVFTAVFIVNKWSVPAQDWGNDAATIASYGQYLSSLTTRQGGANTVIYTSGGVPDSHFITTEPIQMAPGGSVIISMTEPKDGLKYLYMSCYADIDADGSFDGTGELIKTAGTRKATDTGVASAKPKVLLPFDAPLGVTRIRLRLDGAWYANGWNDAAKAFDPDGPTNRFVYDIPVKVTPFAPHTCTVKVKSADKALGSVDINAESFPAGETVVIRAFPADGYKIASYTDANGRVLPQDWMTGNTLTFPAYDNATITAHFEKDLGVEAPLQLPFDLTADGHTVTVTWSGTPAAVTITDTLGRTAATLHAAPTQSVSLAPGLWLVTAAGQTTRLLLP